MSVFDNDTTEKELASYLTDITPKLEAERRRFEFGDGVYVGSEMLRRFYKGNHWTFKKDGGGAMRVYNYCYSVVENMTAFLANETPETHSAPRNIADAIERARSEGITQLLGEVHKINKLPIQYQKGVRIGSLTGVTFIYGPVWDEENKAILYWAMENPENVMPIWADSNFSRLEGFVITYSITAKSFKKKYRKQMEARGIDSSDIDSLATKGPTGQTVRRAEGEVSEPTWKRTGQGSSDVPMVTVQEYLDDAYYITKIIGGDNATAEGKVIDFVQHNYGFIPGIWIPNIHLPGEARGTSDIENILDAQVAYNESKSNEEDIVRQVAFSAMWGKNLDNYSVIQTGMGAVYSFNDEADLQAMPRSANPLVLENFERNIQGDLVNLSGQNQALYPGGARQVLASTGRALSVLMQGINNKVSLRKTYWSDAMEELNRNILILAEKKVNGAKELIDGNYKTEVFISSVLLRDTTEEINKFNAKLQSLTTTQKNLGIPSPSEEQKLMKEELKDPIFGVEIARQPGLLQQVLMQMQQQNMMLAQQLAGGAPGEGGDAANPELAILGSPEEAGTGSQPISTPQQRGRVSTPEGEVAAQAQRNTGAPVSRATR